MAQDQDFSDAQNSETDDEVGYCKPPKRWQFAPRTSGNPRGRPKHAEGRGPILERIAYEPCEVRIDGKPTKTTRLEVNLLAVRNATANGNPAAQKLFDRLLNEVRDDEDIEPPIPKGVAIFPEKLTEEEFEAYGAYITGRGPPPPCRKRGIPLD